MRILILTMLSCLLWGCAATNSGIGSNNGPQAQVQANKYFKLAADAKGQDATLYRLQAVEQLLAAENIEGATQALYNHSYKNLPEEQAAYQKILQAQLALAKRDTHTAQQLLRTIWTPHKLPEDLQIKFFITRSEAYRRAGNMLQAIQERIYLSKHLKAGAEQKQNNQVIWDTFNQLTPNTLRSLQKNTQSEELNGWVAFANIMKQYDSSPSQRFQALQQWRQKYSQHPATAFLPQDVLAAAPPLTRPKKIALLLPLQGKHAQSAQAVRDGFLAAYYANEEQDRPKIQVYDTTENTNLTGLYQRAVEDGAGFVVGPLIKEEVESISVASKSRVPVLALNTTNSRRPQENLFQFGLAPEHEATTIADKAWRDGHRNALIIVPQSPWGARMKESFIEAWHAKGGTVIAIEEIGAQSNIHAATKKLLAVDQSEARAAQIKALGIKFTTEPRRRQDPDMVFIATNAALARQIKPLLNFYYAANVPAYASSTVYSGKPQPNLDQDLNGIKFCDMPWVLDHSISSRPSFKAVANLWPDKFEQYGRLYALGLDAYKVVMQFDQLTIMPDLGISGMTGMLTLDKQQQVQRKLMWASFKKGIATIDGGQ